jgi:hypothetical protein
MAGESLIQVAEPAWHRDTFARLRVSGPVTLFDSKQLGDDGPLYYDDQEVSGADTTSTFSADRASVTMGVAASTAGRRIRQTFRRFNYQPGKSQLVFLTAVMGEHSTGIEARVGVFDDENGLYFYSEDGVLGVAVRSHITGSAVDTKIPQSAWNLDKMDGSGPQHNPSLVKLDPTKSQIMVIDYEWLGVGFARFGFVVDGQVIYVHQQNHANRIAGVYMSTPNLPVRYEIENTGAGAAAELEQICTTVISEGDAHPTGTTHWISTGGVHVDANDADTVYAIVGVRLKAAYLGETVVPQDISMLCESNNTFEWMLYVNPTVAGTFTYSDVTNAPVQRALGATANEVTGGTQIAGGWGSVRTGITSPIDTALLPGSYIDGTPTTLVLCARPLGANLDIQGGITLRALR